MSHYSARVRGVQLRTFAASRAAIRARTERPWLALVAVPLAMTASLDVVVLEAAPPVWAAWLPLTAAAWWWAPRRQFRWSFLLAAEAGALGVQWSLVGAFALAAWPESRVLIGGIWIAAAGLVAAVAALNRWRYRFPAE